MNQFTTRGFLGLLVLIIWMPGFSFGQEVPGNPKRAPSSSASTADKKSIFNGGGNYLWPTDASRYASSSFGETRAAHFHAALDIKTWGQKGYKVYATRDGVLARVGVWAVGYGNVVYLQHDDGTYSVYAHLEDFVPRIRDLVDSLRLTDYQFELNHVVNDRTIRFEKGDLIGYSGASGVGPPHLHFELRTAQNHPFNPLLTNLSIPDHRAPRFDGLAIEPLSADALVEGRKEIYTRNPRYREGSYHYGTVEVRGTVGLAANVFDLADRVSNAYAAYELLLTLDSNVLFHSRIDSFSYNRSRQLFLDRIYPLLKKSNLGYQRLYVADGNTLPFYRETQSNNGKLRLPPGKHTLTITARDFYGNKRKAKVTLDVQPSNADTLENVARNFRPPSQTNYPPLSPNVLDDWIWNENWIAYSTPQKRPAFNYKATHSMWDPFQFSYFLEVGEYHVIPIRRNRTLVEVASGRAVEIHRISPSERRRIQAGSPQVSALFRKNTLFDTLSVALATEKAIDSRLATIHLYPPNQPLQSSYQLSYTLSDTTLSTPLDKWGFYEIKSSDKEPEYIPTKIHGTHRLTAEAKHLGTFALLADTVRPEIREPKLYRESDGQWYVSVKVSDNRSGIAYKKARMYVNGQRGIPRYDPEHKRLIYYHPAFKPRANNELRVVLPDKKGNRRENSYIL